MTRIEANAAYREILSNPADVRELALNDLFFLLVYVLNRPDADNEWLHARCREVETSPDGYLDLWAREHYKSTIITWALTVQDILRDPEITVGIFSHTRPISKSFLRQIKREFEQNKLLQELFPHICPPVKGETRTWSEDDGLVVRRRANPKEATLEAWGLVDGQPTGKHFSLMVYDDVVTLSSVTTPEQIRKTTDAWKLSLNLGAKGGRRRMIGTRYHTNDTYAEILRSGSAIPRVYPATADGLPEGGAVLLSSGALAEKLRDMGSYVFACQMLQNPLADAAMGFKREWLQYWRVSGEAWQRMNRYILVDPAGEKKKGSDYTVMWVVGLNHDGAYYLIDGIRDRLNLTQKADALMRLHREYRPIGVGYEKYGMQADIEFIRTVQDRQTYHFSITELGGPMPKNDRIRRLVPHFEQRRVYIPNQIIVTDAAGRARNLTTEFVDEEYTTFPVSAHDDMLDCMARITDPDMHAAFPGIKPKYGDMDIHIPAGAW